MRKIQYYRDENLPIFEIKNCSSKMHSSKKHYHNELSIGIIEEGSTIVESNGEEFRVNRNNAIFIYPGVIHKCIPKDINIWGFRMIYVNMKWIESSVGKELKKIGIAVKSLKEEEIIKLNEFFDFLQSNSPEMEKEIMLINKLEYLFELEEIFHNDINENIKNIYALESIKEHIYNNYLDKITLDELTELSGLSKYYIVRLYKQAYKTTPHAYQTLLRLNYAKEKLLKGFDLVEVAQMAGFYDQSHFNKAFKQCFGVTPLKYSFPNK